MIGLEIHVQLATQTKMFCGCELSFGDPPNTHTCPVCLGLPGSLPVANARAVHFGLMIGLALGSRARAALDLPPQELLLSGPAEGLPDLPVRRAPLPRRAPRRGAHPPRPPGGGRGEADPRRRERAHPRLGRELVDFNRGGTPLAEIVTEPDMRSAEQASEWLKLLRTTLRAARRQRREHGGGLAALRRQHLAAPAGTEELGAKTELKNMNSFRFIERGIQRGDRAPAEDDRGRRDGRAGDAALRPGLGAITSLRSKEEAHDYRYFPEPDLLPVAIDEADARRGRARR